MAGVIFVFWQQSQQKPNRFDREETAIAGLIEGKDAPEIQELLNRTVSEGMVDIIYNASPTFGENGKRGNINVQNIPGNRYSFIITLTLDSTGETLYKSNLINPGYYVQYIGLNKTFTSGSYPATLKFEVYDISGDTDDKIGEVKDRKSVV